MRSRRLLVVGCTADYSVLVVGVLVLHLHSHVHVTMTTMHSTMASPSMSAAHVHIAHVVVSLHRCAAVAVLRKHKGAEAQNSQRCQTKNFLCQLSFPPNRII